MEEDPPLLSSDESPIATSSLSQVWTRLHNLGVKLDNQDRSLSALQVSVAGQNCKCISLASLVHEAKYDLSATRVELADIRRKLQELDDRLVRCERHLNLDSLD